MRWFNWLLKPLKTTVTASKCGHETKLSGTVVAFGTSTETRMPSDANGSTDYCLDCIGKMAIRCAWCGGPIFIGDPITLYVPRSEQSFRQTDQEEFEFVENTHLGFRVPAHAVTLADKPWPVVGCLRMDCADTGADRAGFWVPGADGQGTIKRIQSAYEMIMSTGEPLIINDLNDQSAVQYPDIRKGAPEIHTTRVV